MTSIVEFDTSAAAGLQATLGAEAKMLADLPALRSYLSAQPFEYAVVLGPSVDQAAALQLAEEMRVLRPALGVILVRRRVDSSLLTDSLRAGIRDVVSQDDMTGLALAVQSAYKLSNALRQQDGSTGEAAASRRGKIVTVFAAKGGSGKTTIATNLATILAEGDKSVALIDLDLAFGDVAIAMHLSPSRTIADAVRMEDTLDIAALRSLMTKHSSGVQVLVAPLDPSLADQISTSLVIKAIDLLQQEYDYVVVDCPPALNDHVLAAFDVSDTVTLLATLDVPSLKNLKLTLDMLNLLNFERERIKILLNRADSKVGLEIADVEKTINMPVAARIPSSVDVPYSTNRGVVLAMESPSHAASVAMRTFARTALAVEVVPTQTADLAAETNDRRGRRRRRQAA